jgi:predicted transcriptional regulator
MANNIEAEAVSAPGADSGSTLGWTFLSNHAHVIVCLTQDPKCRLRDVAYRVGITERAVQRIVAELEEAGYITRRREGRQNRYEIHRNQPLRHVIEMHRTVGDLLDSLK